MMRYTGKKWLKRGSMKPLHEQIRDRKWHLKLKGGQSIPLKFFHGAKQVKKALENGLLAVSGRW